MKIVFFGFGSIGQRYAKILLKDFNCELFAYRTGRGGKCHCSNVEEVYTWNEVEKIRPNISFIVNPTSLHIETAIKCALSGMHLFIEKPLDMKLDDFSRLKKIVEAKNLTAYVAYNLRFHPGIRELKRILSETEFWHATVYSSSWLPDWRPNKDHLETYSAKKKLGGGAILDLSHEIDYVQYVFGKIKKIEGVCGRVSDVTVDSEDVADMIATLENGKYVSIHLDFCNYNLQRSIRVMTNKGFFLLDLVDNQLYGKDGKKQWNKKYTVGKDDTYKEQIKAFFENIGSKNIVNNLDEAGELLEKILIFKQRTI